ncbi:uncharacterized protein BDV17DRAFT_253492 [Aspergillus undulatus]|uniref:uncharacterized protein n=1 Tax=Aspergillus undulatus TaxID=1810928 RepID=UPI003CCCF7BF
MQLALRGRHASVIAREIRAVARQLPHTRTSPLRSSGVAAGIRRIYVSSALQSLLWSKSTRSGLLGFGKTATGVRRLYGQPTLDTGLHRQWVTTDAKKQTRELGSSERNGSEEIEEEGTERLRRETRPRDAFGSSTQRGKLLTTPSRLLKLLIPLPTDHTRDVETIAILTHSQQPLSYLEQLIQAELPPIKDEDGRQRQPGVSFIAFQYENHPIRPRKARSKKTKHNVDSSQEMEVEEVAVADDKGEGHPETSQPPDEELDTYSSLQKPQPNGESEQRYVRWSHATEIGDFIRDAARAGEFIVAIGGAPLGLDQIKITVPSFNERTHYLRMRLRKISDRIKTIADIKHECDQLAHRGAQRVALGGFGVLVSWWCLVYKLTFDTDLGWDTMEPITYLASLSTLMGGYLWFLYHNREISYRSALDFTINARQKKLYQLRGVDLQLWENLIYEGNALRREIKTISSDYDTEWDEKHDERDERVVEALKKERDQQKRKDESEDEKEGSND